MGLLSDLMKMATPAMEADDITMDVENEKNAVLGSGRSVRTTSANVMQRRKDDDVTKTDDIFGLKDNSPGGGEKTPEDADPNAEETPEDNPDEETPEDDGAENTDAAVDGMDDPIDSTEDTEKQQDGFDKNTLRDIMLLFYNVLSTNIASMTNALTAVDNPESAVIINQIIGRFNECKSIIFKEITEDIQTHSYTEALRVYVATRRVYDICVEILDKHFDNIIKPGGKKP